MIIGFPSLRLQRDDHLIILMTRILLNAKYPNSTSGASDMDTFMFARLRQALVAAANIDMYM